MTFGGWIVMLVSIASVVTLASYCLVRVLSASPPRDD
jgi:hypothetical protein